MPPVAPGDSLPAVVTFHGRALAYIAAEVRRRPAEEVGGLLTASPGGPIEWVYFAGNHATDPTCGFEFDPWWLSAALDLADRRGEEFVGTWHSHPNGRVDLSAEDVRLAEATGLLLVVAVDVEGGTEFALYDPGARGRVDFGVNPPMTRK